MDPQRSWVLVDDLVEEILLWISPDDPASLIRAALVCKDWCRLILGAAFRRRFCALHRRAPMLGFLVETGNIGACTTYFRPTSSFRIHTPKIPKCRHPIDARHGRILFQDEHKDLWVWCPLVPGGAPRKLPDASYKRNMNARLLCEAPGCDHLDCSSNNGGPFKVALIGTLTWPSATVDARLYSSEHDEWSQRVPHHCCAFPWLEGSSSAHVNNIVYFNPEPSTRVILAYRYWGKQQYLFPVDLPPECENQRIALMATEDGNKLGLVTVRQLQLCIWSMGDSDNALRWIKQRVVKLAELLPTRAVLTPQQPQVFGIADDLGVVFIRTSLGLFTVDLKSFAVRKLLDGCGFAIHAVVPYTSFCIPGSALMRGLCHV